MIVDMRKVVLDVQEMVRSRTHRRQSAGAIFPGRFRPRLLDVGPSNRDLLSGSEFHAPGYEAGIRWEDPAIGIEWPDPPMQPSIIGWLTNQSGAAPSHRP